MSAEAGVLQPSPLPPPAQLVGQVIQFYANLPTDGATGGKNLTGQVRDIVKSILRGVWDFIAIPDQNDWYPNPAMPTPNATVDGKAATYGIYNLDPYVWFVHDVEHMAGYAFSVDDDVANPAAPGPIAAPGSTPTNPITNHLPGNLQIAYGGIQGFGTPTPWFPTIPWGSIATTATISQQSGGTYDGAYIITLTAKDALTLFNQINNPGPGQVGAYVTAAGFIPKGTTLIFKGPNGDTNPQIVMQLPANGTIKLSDKPINITITGTIPTAAQTRLLLVKLRTPAHKQPHIASMASHAHVLDRKTPQSTRTTTARRFTRRVNPSMRSVTLQRAEKSEVTALSVEDVLVPELRRGDLVIWGKPKPLRVSRMIPIARRTPCNGEAL